MVPLPRTGSLGLIAFAVLAVLASVTGCAESEARQRERPAATPTTSSQRSVPARTPPPTRAARPAPRGLRDRGIFPRFDPTLRLRVVSTLAKSRTSIVVDKARRLLVLRADGVPIRIYPIRLGSQPRGHKQRQGDGRTPEGRYTIVQAERPPLARRYGARSLRLSYPNLRDGTAGRRRGLITAAELRAIARAERLGRTPPQRTRLGGSIRIHGGGLGRDWTLGCIAMHDADIIELYRYVRVGTPVEVHAGGGPHPPWKDTDGDAIPDQIDVLRGALKAARNGARYHSAYVRLAYPGGDVPARQGVCTDVIVRAFRNAGIDLQVALYQDVRAHPQRYPGIKRPDRNIDHRRVRNLLPFFRAHYRLVNRRVPASRRHTLLPGDVVFLDTLPRAGPDHIGIIADTVGANGWPQVINNWTVGYHTQAMDLLPGVPITHHFRLR